MNFVIKFVKFFFKKKIMLQLLYTYSILKTIFDWERLPVNVNMNVEEFFKDAVVYKLLPGTM